MALTGRISKLVWGGTMWGIDEWANSLTLICTGAPTKAPLDFLPAITAFFGSAAVRHQKNTTLSYVKFNEINPLTGKYADAGASHTHLVTPVIAGPTSSTDSIPQAALAITLRTAVARGRTSHGRFFVPFQIPSPLVGGLLDPGTAEAIAAAARTFINAINAVDPTSGVVVFSKVGQISSPVTGIAVGRVIDTQRRRRSSLKELPVLVGL